MTGPGEATKPPAATDRRSLAAIARSAGGDRAVVALLGFVLLAAGVLVVLLSYGVFGGPRATRPLLDPMIVDALRASPLVARLTAIVAGLLLTVLGLVWAAGSLRPERRPDLVLDGGPDTSIIITAGAAAEAVAAQASTLPGVGRARARLVGPQHSPALRITLWLTDDADVKDVLNRLHGEVVSGVTNSLGLTSLPVAVRLELDGAGPHPRVA